MESLGITFDPKTRKFGTVNEVAHPAVFIYCDENEEVADMFMYGDEKAIISVVGTASHWVTFKEYGTTFRIPNDHVLPEADGSIAFDVRFAVQVP